MSIIGDLFFLLRGDGKQLEVDVKKAGDKAGTSFGARMSASLKKSWSGQEIGKGLVQGLGLAGGLGAAALFSTAISKIGDVLSDATQAALAEEVSIQKLGTALKANIPNWNGQTAAIEKVLQARLKLGFSDDEQRESLALLVVATKDETKALEIQRTAMDLARLKGISLAEASQALIKVEAGQFRALKALGIQLGKNATAEDALLAVQKAAAGQAEDYANTNAGKLLVSQVKVGEAMEKLGAVVLPVVVELMTAAADAVTALSDAFDFNATKVEDNQDLLGNLKNVLSDLSGRTGESKTAIGALDEGITDLAAGLLNAVSGSEDLSEALFGVKKAAADAGDASAAAAVDFRASEKNIGGSGAGVEGTFFDVGAAARAMAQRIKTGVDNIKTWVAGLRSTLAREAQLMIDGYYDPIIAQQELLIAKDESAAALRERNATKAGTAERRQADLTLSQSRRALDEARLNLLEAGKLSGKEQSQWLANLKLRYKAETGDAKKRIGELIAKIEELKRAGKTVPVNINVNVAAFTPSTSRTTRNRAVGGPVYAGQPYIVGERRAELFVPNVDGRIEPRVSSMAGAEVGGGSPTNVYLSTYGMPLRAETPAEQLATYRRAARIGAVKPPRKTGTWE